MVNILGNAQYTACQATGKIRNYTIVITSIGCLVFPVTWILYKCGMPVETAYYVFIVIYFILDVSRLFFMRSLLQFPIRMYVREVFVVITLVTVTATILPIIEIYLLPQVWWRLIVTFVVSSISVAVSIYMIGLTESERGLIVRSIKSKLIYK